MRVVNLGREIFSATALVSLLGRYTERKRLNLTEFTRLSAQGLREMLSLCPEVTAVFTAAHDMIIESYNNYPLESPLKHDTRDL